jgi:KUP system potassium uptake protein
VSFRTPSGSAPSRTTVPLAVSALGVVFGDIGTSPLYAMRECFFGPHAVPPTHENVLGVLSLIVYSLVVVISVKYVAVVMRADNDGEGGILALTALVLPEPGSRQRRAALVLLGIFGAALLYGDGMITPAITVLGAVEGLTMVTPVFEPYVVPVAVAILVAVFAIQRHGTHVVGRLFGPVMVVWFVTLAALGLAWIAREPAVLSAVDPRHAVGFFREHGWHGFTVLGAVFLVVTGGEALYADMGHFGTRPIRLAWFIVVLPALILNYFGQGALLLVDSGAAEQPFFRLAPGWSLLPLVALATAAAVIASQALISGAFSLTRQAVQLGYSPRLDVAHTSSDEMGQVYVPQVNWLLAICTVLIVVGFRSSTALAAAYGIAVSMTMIITAVLLYVVAVERWHWPVWFATVVTAVFLAIDLAFFGANLLKVFQGGWLPLVIGGALFTVMTTWKTGRRLVGERLTSRAVPLEDFLASVAATRPMRVPGTAVFMTAQPHGTPPALVHNLRYNKMLHAQIILLTVTTTRTPHVAATDRWSVLSLGQGLFSVRAQVGFMEDPDVPAIVRSTREHGIVVDEADLTYFLGRETIVASRQHGMPRWRERLFMLISRNAVRATAYFHLPPERVVELGVQVDM